MAEDITCSKLTINDACLGTDRNTVVGTYTLVDQSTYPCQRTNVIENSPIYIRRGFHFNDILFYNPTFNSWWVTEERWYCSNDDFSRAEFEGDSFSPLSSTASNVLCWNTTDFVTSDDSVQVTTDFDITCSDNDNTIPRYADISSVCDDFKEQDFVEIYRRDCRDAGTFEGFLVRCKNGVFDGMNREPVSCTDLFVNHPNFSFCHRCEDDIQGASIVCADTSNKNSACNTIAKSEDECTSGISGISLSSPCTSDKDWVYTDRLCDYPTTDTILFNETCPDEAPVCGNSCFGYEICSSSKVEGCGKIVDDNFIPTNSSNENNQVSRGTDNDKDSTGLAVGAIIGIVVGGVFVIFLCVVACVLIMTCKKKSSTGTRSYHKNEQDEYNDVREITGNYMNQNGERKMTTTDIDNNVSPVQQAEVVEAVPMHNPSDYSPHYKDQTRTVVSTKTVSSSVPSADSSHHTNNSNTVGNLSASEPVTYNVEVLRRPDP